MDILIPLGKETAWQNNELRYCLRSIERYATGYDRVFVVGEDPGFIRQNEQNLQNNGAGSPPSRLSENNFVNSVNSVRFFPLKDIGPNKEARIALKILRAFEKTDISDDAVLFNDDYVLNEPVDLSKVLNYHRGEIADAIPLQGCRLYRVTLANTLSALQFAGKPTLHYDVHVPMILHRAAFIGLTDWWNKSLTTWQGLLVKSVYANNVLDHPGPRIPDLKIVHFRQPFDPSGRWVFSYADSALKPGLGQWLANRFPAKSKFEK